MGILANIRRSLPKLDLNQESSISPTCEWVFPMKMRVSSGQFQAFPTFFWSGEAKSSFHCAATSNWLQSFLKIAVVNLDPANDALPYPFQFFHVLLFIILLCD
nr:uncharacterized protein LOC114822986 [Malus domestica]